MEKDIAKLKKINQGVSSNGKTQILEGVASGDLVITLGHEKLKDGSKIQLIEK